MTANEKKHLADLLESCRAILSRRGCNDFPVENTAENWLLNEKVMAWASSPRDGPDMTLEEWRKHPDAASRPPLGEQIFFYDWMLLGYLTEKFLREVG